MNKINENKIMDTLKIKTVLDDSILEVKKIENKIQDEIKKIEDEQKEIRIIDLERLKSDFEVVRKTLYSLINHGNNILQQIEIIDIGDLKASTIQAISNLHSTIGRNLEILISIYQKIIDIEKSYQNLENKNYKEENEKIINNTVIFQGTTKELIEIIKNKK